MGTSGHSLGTFGWSSNVKKLIQDMSTQNEISTVSDWTSFNEYEITDTQVSVKSKFEDFMETKNWENYIHNCHLNIV